MQPLDFLQLVEQRLAALEARLQQVDLRLTEEVKKAVSIAQVDLPSSLGKVRYVLELVICDIYRRELPVNDQQTFAEAVLDDFAKLRQRGIDHPDMKKIEAMLRATPQ